MIRLDARREHYIIILLYMHHCTIQKCKDQSLVKRVVQCLFTVQSLFS